VEQREVGKSEEREVNLCVGNQSGWNVLIIIPSAILC